jgi:hypothetical protein
MIALCEQWRLLLMWRVPRIELSHAHQGWVLELQINNLIYLCEVHFNFLRTGKTFTMLFYEI